MTSYLIIPGLGNSGPGHWQTFFEHSGNNFVRIQQKEWDAPSCADWLSTIDEYMDDFDPSSVILVGHSLGCTAIAHWARQSGKIIKGALLVAPSDIENPVYTFPAIGFAPIPLDKIQFPTIVVASMDDPWVTPDRSKYFADHWGSNYVNIGNAGHINALSGFGQWEQGLEILHRLD